MYEVFYAPSAGRFDILDAGNMPLTSVHAVTQFPANKRAVIGAFFDLRKIDTVCRDHGLVFVDR